MLLWFQNLPIDGGACLHKLAHRNPDPYPWDRVAWPCVCLLTLAGGPADQAGLQQLDTLLQLNGQPVEQWKCVDLAHAIR